MIKRITLASSILLLSSTTAFATTTVTEPNKVVVSPGGDAVTVIPKKCRTLTYTNEGYAVGVLTTFLTQGFNVYYAAAAGFATSFTMNQLPSRYICAWQYRVYNDSDNRWHLYQTIVSYKYSNYTTPLRTQYYRLGYY